MLVGSKSHRRHSSQGPKPGQILMCQYARENVVSPTSNNSREDRELVRDVYGLKVGVRAVSIPR